MPAADAQALGDGTPTVNVSGKDAAGYRERQSDDWRGYCGTDHRGRYVAQDNIINAAEHHQPLTLSGKNHGGSRSDCHGDSER